jgi:hypothetical protein
MKTIQQMTFITPATEDNPHATIRDLDITVWELLRELSSGKSEAEIIECRPELNHGDFLAAYWYACIFLQTGGPARIREIGREAEETLRKFKNVCSAPPPEEQIN